MAKDYYNTLGISKGASADEIKQAFRKLAHQHHPDKASGDEAKFKEINEAYQVLSNPEKRQQYDQYGQTFEQAQAQGGFGGARDFSGFANGFGGGGQRVEFDFGNIGDLFGDLFGGGGRAKTRTKRRSKGADIGMDTQIEFEEAAFGAEKDIELYKDIPCPRCGGQGAEPGSKVSQCRTCGGTGQVVKNIGFGFGFPSVCTECTGSGEIHEKKCTECRGQGITKDTRKMKVKIPAGIDDGQTIRLRGEGETGQRGGVAGDLFLTIHIKPNKKYTREGFNVLSQAEISISQAALGTSIEIETIDGLVKLKIPDGTQSGRIFQLKGKGIPRLDNYGRGDHLVEVTVATPTRLNRQQRKIFEQLREEGL